MIVLLLFDFFAVLAVRVHHVVLIPSFKLLSFFTFIFAVLRSWVGDCHIQVHYSNFVFKFPNFRTMITGVGLR